MSIRIALAGNPNCGKTTLFNELTGSSQYVGNWPGVTVEKKDGLLKGHKDVIIQDLPGIYSLSPYTLEEKVARNYLVNEQPDAILNIIDGTNLERNLYLTTQLVEIGLPVVLAINMMDLVKKNGDSIDTKKLGQELGCEVVEISALQGTGCKEAAERALEAAKEKRQVRLPSVFTGSVEHAIAHIEESISDKVEDAFVRWYAIKVFERDQDATAALQLDPKTVAHLEGHIKDCEDELDDDAESIIINQRYAYIAKIIGEVIRKKRAPGSMTVSDKIDHIVTNQQPGYAYSSVTQRLFAFSASPVASPEATLTATVLTTATTAQSAPATASTSATGHPSTRAALRTTWSWALDCRRDSMPLTACLVTLMLRATDDLDSPPITTRRQASLDLSAPCRIIASRLDERTAFLLAHCKPVPAGYVLMMLLVISSDVLAYPPDLVVSKWRLAQRLVQAIKALEAALMPLQPSSHPEQRVLPFPHGDRRHSRWI